MLQVPKREENMVPVHFSKIQTQPTQDDKVSTITKTLDPNLFFFNEVERKGNSYML
jgi:hypothetical protein